MVRQIDFQRTIGVNSYNKHHTEEMVGSSSTLRNAPDEIEKIISIVRLLPVDCKIRNFRRAFDRLACEYQDELEQLRRTYEVEDSESLWSLISSPSVMFLTPNTHSNWPEITKDRQTFLLEKYRLFLRCLYESVLLCVRGLPEAFVNHVAAPVSCRSIARTYLFRDPYHKPIDPTMDSILIQASISRLRDGMDFHRRAYLMMEFLKNYQKFPSQGTVDAIWNENFFALHEVFVNNSRLDFRMDSFTRAFNGVDITRLRLCEYEPCGKIFWLRRLPKENWKGNIGCSKKCSGALRTKDWREKTTDKQRLKYKINRVNR